MIAKSSMNTRTQNINADFVCKHCHSWVSTDSFLAGVENRNHCPYCLWSRHLDLYQAGDRLSACKGGMRPVGLTLKREAKKYTGRASGELMLIHQCEECGKLSINRIAADDLADNIFAIFESSRRMKLQAPVEIEVLRDESVVRARLFGCVE